jgi:predicted  nucleic acid-binding Zn-ribbon protein
MEERKNCQQRLPEHLAGRLQDMAEMAGEQMVCNACGHEWDDTEAETCPECGSNNVSIEEKENDERMTGEDVLAVDKRVVYDICLSTSGPEDGFEVEVDDRAIARITYYFKDWFDGARRILSGEEFDAVEEWILREVYIEELS